MSKEEEWWVYLPLGIVTRKKLKWWNRWYWKLFKRLNGWR